MSISGQNLTVVIVTLKSEQVVEGCINSIEPNIPIIIVENSNNIVFKKKIEDKFKNVQCVLTEENLGMGRGNNIGIKLAKTDYVYILNPDVVLEKNTLQNIYLSSKEIEDFSILTPLNLNKDFPNWKNNISNNYDNLKPFKVDSVDGYSMLINKKKFNNTFFDENIFLFLENDDLCLRVKKMNGSIYIIPQSKINHKGSAAINPKYKDEIEFSRNWHWIWSKFYFQKKHFGFFKASIYGFPIFFRSIIKFVFFLLINNKKKKKIYFNRTSGYINALLGKPSWYRPNLKDQ